MLLTPDEVALRLATAAAIGLMVGTEREWSGPVSGPERRFAGIRTFFLMGLLGGLGGVLLVAGHEAAAGLLVGAGAALVVAEYILGGRRTDAPLSGTTEVAAIVVVGLGVLAALGFLRTAAGCGAAVVFALGEKDRLHWLVRRIGAAEMHGTLQFLALALVILPLLPAEPLFGLEELRPRGIWIMVLILLAIDFVGYLARRSVGPEHGYGITGAIAGLVSSTALTLQFARLSRVEPDHARGLGLGIVAACLVLPLRLLLISFAVAPRVAGVLLWYLVPSLLITILAMLPLLRGTGAAAAPVVAAPEAGRSPLRLGNAMTLAVLFAVVLVSVDWAQARWGDAGVIGSSVLFGLTDLDALTLSMSRMAAGSGLADLAARGIAIGLIVNTAVKATITVALGSAAMRRSVPLAIGMGMAPVALVLWWRW